MAQEFIGLSLQFMAQNWINIAWGLLTIFLIVSYIIINNIQFKKVVINYQKKVVMQLIVAYMPIMPRPKNQSV